MGPVSRSWPSTRRSGLGPNHGRHPAQTPAGMRGEDQVIVMSCPKSFKVRCMLGAPSITSSVEVSGESAQRPRRPDNPSLISPSISCREQRQQGTHTLAARGEYTGGGMQHPPVIGLRWFRQAPSIRARERERPATQLGSAEFSPQEVRSRSPSRSVLRQWLLCVAHGVFYLLVLVSSVV